MRVAKRCTSTADGPGRLFSLQLRKESTLVPEAKEGGATFPASCHLCSGFLEKGRGGRRGARLPYLNGPHQATALRRGSTWMRRPAEEAGRKEGLLGLRLGAVRPARQDCNRFRPRRGSRGSCRTPSLSQGRHREGGRLEARRGA